MNNGVCTDPTNRANKTVLQKQVQKRSLSNVLKLKKKKINRLLYSHKAKSSTLFSNKHKLSKSIAIGQYIRIDSDSRYN